MKEFVLEVRNEIRVRHSGAMVDANVQCSNIPPHVDSQSRADFARSSLPYLEDIIFQLGGM